MARPCRRVMVVEDDRALLELLEDYFEHENMELVTAENGAEALAKLVTGGVPDVILLDLRMPGLSGEELIARLHAEPAWAHIPVAVMSGDTSRLAFVGGAGLQTLAKPFSIDELVAVLSQHCSNISAEAAS